MLILLGLWGGLSKSEAGPLFQFAWATKFSLGRVYSIDIASVASVKGRAWLSLIFSSQLPVSATA
jgi:hypothetical protein